MKTMRYTGGANLNGTITIETGDANAVTVSTNDEGNLFRLKNNKIMFKRNTDGAVVVLDSGQKSNFVAV